MERRIFATDTRRIAPAEPEILAVALKFRVIVPTVGI